MWNYGLGICVSRHKDTTYPGRAIADMIWLTRSGAFALVRTVLVPTLTASHDPTCELFLPLRHV